jgi:hypothetical protein
MAVVIIYLSILTPNVNGLNSPIKKKLFQKLLGKMPLAKKAHEKVSHSRARFNDRL